jgi:hypothetical protein
MAESTPSTGRKTDERISEESASNRCATEIDRNAPAGSENSLGAKSDCNGRPATDDSVVEAMDEAGPIKKPTGSGDGGR